METWELHSMATLLDPRFKSKGFSTASFAETAKSLVLDKEKEMTETPETQSEGSEGVVLLRNPERIHLCGKTLRANQIPFFQLPMQKERLSSTYPFHVYHTLKIPESFG